MESPPVQSTREECQAALAGGLLVAQVAFAVTGHPRASSATFLLLMVVVLAIRRQRHKKKSPMA